MNVDRDALNAIGIQCRANIPVLAGLHQTKYTYGQLVNYLRHAALEKCMHLRAN